MNARRSVEPPSRRDRRREGTRSRLLDAALAVFLKRGYEAVVLSEITERADLGTGTLYLHFTDKRALYEAVVRRELAAIYRAWAASPRRGGAPIDPIASMVKVALEFLVEHPREARLFLLDGPPVETWLVTEVAKVMAAYIEAPQPELRASLVIGTALAAGRHYLLHENRPSMRALLDTTLAFCSGGATATDPRGAPVERRSPRSRAKGR